MALFLSTYHNKVDKKGRVSVPAPFRAALSGQHFPGVVVYSSFVNPCIEACSLERMEKMAKRIEELDPFSDERDALSAVILGGAVQLGFDTEGRVMLPESLLAKAGIEEGAVFIGKGDTFEIWEPRAFDGYAAKAREIAHQKRLQLRGANGNGGVQ